MPACQVPSSLKTDSGPERVWPDMQEGELRRVETKDEPEIL